MTDYVGFQTALEQLKQLTEHTENCMAKRSQGQELVDKQFGLGVWAADDEHNTASMILRDVLCCLQHDPEATLSTRKLNEFGPDDVVLTYKGSQLSLHPGFMSYSGYGDGTSDKEVAVQQHFYTTITGLIETIIAYEYSRDAITQLAIQDSLCPLHFCDWAICFDDKDPECSQIRMIYPHSHDT